MNVTAAEIVFTGDAVLLQGLWDSARLVQARVLGSLYLPACCGFLTHMALCAPFLLLDALYDVCPLVRSWRMAAGSGPPPPLLQWLECFWRVLWKYATAVLPATALLQTLRSQELPERAPSCWRLGVEVVACFLVFDFFYFVWHYYIHRVPWLYRRIHRMHHRHHNPFALAAQDASAVELLSLLLLALLSARLLGCHPLSEVVFHLLNSWMAVEDHCGYDLPFAMHRLLPGMGGGPHHLSHHRRPNINFAPYFTHWDRLFGTYRATA